MSKYTQGRRRPSGRTPATAVAKACPQCGRRIELKAMSVGLTITKRVCRCMLTPRDFKALVSGPELR